MKLFQFSSCKHLFGGLFFFKESLLYYNNSLSAGLTKAQPPKQRLFPSLLEPSEIAVSKTGLSISKLIVLRCQFYSHKSAGEKKSNKSTKKSCCEFFIFLRWHGFIWGEKKEKNIEKPNPHTLQYIRTLEALRNLISSLK